MPTCPALVAVIDPGPIPFGLLPNAADEACRLLTAGALDRLTCPGEAPAGLWERVLAVGGLDSFLRRASFRIVRLRLVDLGRAIPGEDDFLEPAILEHLVTRYQNGQTVDFPVLWQNPDPDVSWEVIDGTHRLVAALRSGRSELKVFELLSPPGLEETTSSAASEPHPLATT
jgi:hypothetical protein